MSKIPAHEREALAAFLNVAYDFYGMEYVAKIFTDHCKAFFDKGRAQGREDARLEHEGRRPDAGTSSVG